MTELIASPCVGLCELNPETTRCKGCLRSIEEISAWSSYSNTEKGELLQQLEQRRETLDNQ